MTRPAQVSASVFAKTIRAVLALASLTLGAGAAGLGPAEPAKPSGFATLPLCFQAAGGVTGGDFPFLARGRACNFFIGPTDAVLMLTQLDAPPRRAQLERVVASGAPERATRELRFEFVGANSAACVDGLDELPGKASYFLGQNPAQWRTSVPLFGRVRVAQIYPGVDLIYYGNEQRLEYDFVIAPRSDPGRISIHFTGADKVQISPEGELVFTLGRETIRQPRPLVYQTVSGVRKQIAGSYTLDSRQTVAFQLGDYDHELPLVIDPVLSYSTFYGGSGLDVAWAVAVDANGFVYVAGETMGALPTSPGSVTNKYNGAGIFKGDAFVAKFDNAAASLVYLSYLGGSADDVGLSLAVDGEGNAYVTGYTDSPDFPTQNPIYSHINGSVYLGSSLYPIDAFVTKLGPAGTNLVYSTYLGGNGVDEGVSIAVDKAGAAYVTGYTESTNFPTLTDLTARTNYGGGGDAFLTKVSAAGTNLIYSMYLGGTNLDAGSGVAANDDGIAFVTGYTKSTNFPVFHAFQPRLAGGMDAFVTAIGTSGTDPVFSTYLGGGADNAGFRIALDAASNFYVTGITTEDQNFPVSPSELNPGGVFRSDNGATSWNVSSAGLASVVVRALAVDPFTPARIYAGTARGVVRSIDGGASWSTEIGVSAPNNISSPAIAVGGVNALAIDPATPTTLYAGVNLQGVYKSLDAGTNWSLTSSNLSLSVVALAVDPVTPTTVYAGTLGGGIFKSTNAAINWSAINNGLAEDLSVEDLAFDPTSPATLYAATEQGVYRTTNSGAAWLAAKTGLSNSPASAIVIDPGTPATLYVATGSGIFQSTNAAITWRPVNTGLVVTNMSFTSLAIDPLAPATLYAGTSKGVFKSSDAGDSWSAFTNGLSVPSVLSLALNPQSSATLYAGLLGNSFFGGEDVFVYKAGNNGNGFSAVFGGAQNDEGWDVAVDSAGHAHIVGVTYSTNFPTRDARGLLSTTKAGGADAFLTELTADGGALVQSAYLGGSGADLAYGIALDSAGNSYFVGETSSTDFPIRAPFQSTFGGVKDAFLAKLAGDIDVAPTLQITSMGSDVTLSWSAFGPEFSVQTSTDLADPNAWITLATAAVRTNGTFQLQLEATNAASYFRLRR